MEESCNPHNPVTLPGGKTYTGLGELQSEWKSPSLARNNATVVQPIA
jgi:hypothetical protein